MSSNNNNDQQLVESLRPRSFAEFIGQTALMDQLKVFVEAAKQRGDALDHVLFYGPPGLGKTTLATILACEMGVQVKITSGPAIERAGDLAALLTNAQEGDIIFIDEIHRLNKTVEEILYPAMEDHALDLVLGKGPSARTVRLELAHFTLIGATTRVGKLSSPLRDRFGLIHRLQFYDAADLAEIVDRNSNILQISLDPGINLLIAQRSRGTPRIANRLLSRVRDYAQVAGVTPVTERVVNDALQSIGVDLQGLTLEDRRYLEILINKFHGGPVGVKTMAASLAEDEETIEEVIEPYLLQLGFIKRTSRGRVATAHAYSFLGLTPPQEQLL